MSDQGGGWETWKWDESLFAGAAEHYTRGRLPYAPGLAATLAGELGLDGHGRLLDVGCGPGTVTVQLAHLFDAVVGLDPDPGMIAEAQRCAADRGATNATWVQRRAESLPGDLGVFRVVTFAASFHWMDRPRVVAAVRSMLDAGGAAAQIDAPGYRLADLHAEGKLDLPHPAPPDDAIDDLRRHYLGPDIRAGRGIRNTSPSGEDDVFRAAGFAPGRRVVVPDRRVLAWTIDDLVAERFSSSPSAPHLFGDRLGQFEADLRRLLADASPSGLFSVRLPDNVLHIWT